MCGPGRLLLFSEPCHPQLEESKPLPRILPSEGPGLRTGRCLISKPINLILKMEKLRPRKGQSEVATLVTIVECRVLWYMLGEVGGSKGKRAV